MKLSKIIDYIKPLNIENPFEIEVLGVSYNSKTTKTGDVFVCLEGERVDGHDFVEKAQENGAVAIVARKKIETDLPLLLVKDTKFALAQIANILNDFPSRKINMIGVTGTNGKTTVTHLIEKIFEQADKKCGLIGTLGQRMSSEAGYTDAKHTTPQAPELQQTIKKMNESGIENLVMEVSSHSLEQHRVGCCEFNSVVFTNLTQDHLDYHITMDNYFKAKGKLFQALNDSSKQNKYAVINNDDPSGSKFAKMLSSEVKLITYSVKNQADIMAENISFSAKGSSFDCSINGNKKRIDLQIAGMFSIYNTLAALAVGIQEGIDLDLCIKALESTQGVAGRFETITKEPLCIVDYAHTPDGLKNVLKAAKEIVPEEGELICVFGCGGDRDATKRPQMGSIAENLADKIIVTSDNPRTEDPQQIITDILSGIKTLTQDNVVVEIDRKSAIEYALENSKSSDVIVVAGKGHEDYQILRDKTIHFDDREEVEKAFKRFKECKNEL